MVRKLELALTLGLYGAYIAFLAVLISSVSHRTELDRFLEAAVLAYTLVVFPVDVLFLQSTGKSFYKILRYIVIVIVAFFVSAFVYFVFDQLLVGGRFVSLHNGMRVIPEPFSLFKVIVTVSILQAQVFYISQMILYWRFLGLQRVLVHIPPVLVSAAAFYWLGVWLYTDRGPVFLSDKILFVLVAIVSVIIHRYWCKKFDGQWIVRGIARLLGVR